MYAEVKEGNCTRILDPRFLDNEEYFEIAYREFGNDALPPYILKCILNHDHLHKKTIDRLLDIVANLSPVEKTSLKACLEDKIQLHKMRNDEGPDALTPAAVGLAAGFIAANATGNPFVGAGVGLLTGAGTFFGKNAISSTYQHYQDNQFDSLKQQFYKLLDDNQLSSAFKVSNKP